MIGVQALQKRSNKIQQENAALRSEVDELRLENAVLETTVQQSHRQIQELLRQVKAISGRLDAASNSLAQSR